MSKEPTCQLQIKALADGRPWETSKVFLMDSIAQSQKKKFLFQNAVHVRWYVSGVLFYCAVTQSQQAQFSISVSV